MGINTVIPVANGGTGATNAAAVRTNIGAMEDTTVPINKGGTGATNAAAARTNIGAAPAYQYSTTDPGVGSSLTTGTLYIVYTA